MHVRHGSPSGQLRQAITTRHESEQGDADVDNHKILVDRIQSLAREAE